MGHSVTPLAPSSKHEEVSAAACQPRSWKVGTYEAGFPFDESRASGSRFCDVSPAVSKIFFGGVIASLLLTGANSPVVSETVVDGDLNPITPVGNNCGAYDENRGK